MNLRTFGKASFIAGFAALAVAAGCLASPSGGTVKIGFIGPLTGDAAAYGVVAQKTTKLVVKQLNAAGGINGQQVEVVYEDTQCDGKAGASAVQKLTGSDKVVAIIGGLCSSETLGGAPFAEQAKVPLISFGSSSPKISTSGDYIFRTYPSDLGKGKLVAKMALAKGYKKVGVLAEQTDFSLGLKDAFADAFKAGGGEAVVETYTTESTDLRTQLVKLRDAKVEALFVDPQTPNKGLLAFQQMKEMKWKTQLFTNDPVANDTDTLTKEKEFVEGMLAADVAVRDTDPAVLKLRADYKAEYNEDLNYEVFADATYDAMMLIKWAVEKTGSTEGMKLKDAFYTVKDYKGLVGTFSFDTNGDPTLEHSALMVKDGKLVAAPADVLQSKTEATAATPAADVKTEVKAEEKTAVKDEEKNESKAEAQAEGDVKVEVKTE